MKSQMLKFVTLVFVSTLFAGCSSTGEKTDAGMGEGAPVSESGMGSGGAQISGASEGGAWGGRPLDNPDSLLYTKVIFFDYYSSELRPEYQDVVMAHGDYLAVNPAITVTVEGHTDERGSREYNIGLGERRANTIKRLLMAQGVLESQVVTVSSGEERPMDVMQSESAWSQNRRAELVY